MSNSVVDGNAAAVAGERAEGKHTYKECNVQLGKYSAAERLILYVVVLMQDA